MEFDNLPRLLLSHYNRFNSRYESEYQDILVHLRLLKTAVESQGLVYEIWKQKEGSIYHKVAFAYKIDPNRNAKLSSNLTENGLKICSAESFQTRDGFSLDVFLVEGLIDRDIDEFYNLLGFAVAEDAEKFQNHEFDLRLITNIGEQISSESANTYRGTYQGRDIIVKKLRNNVTALVQETFWRGMQKLRGLQHPNIVQFLGANTTTSPLTIVTDYIHGGNLFDYMKRNHDSLTLSQRLKLAIDVSKGVEYMHRELVIHKNINPWNLLLDRDEVVKVDISTASYLNWAGMVTAPKETELMLASTHNPKIRRWCKWSAPEAVTSQERCGDRADVYSFGMILWHLLTAEVPYGDLDRLTPRQTYLRVVGGQRPVIPAGTNPKLKKVIDDCLDADPMYRPHISKVISCLESLLSEINTPAAPPRSPAAPPRSPAAPPRSPAAPPRSPAAPPRSPAAPPIPLSNRFDCLPNE